MSPKPVTDTPFALPSAWPTSSTAEIITALGVQADGLHSFFIGIPPEQFSTPLGARWSPAQHAQHLVQSVRPLAMVLRWPSLVQALQWVRPVAGHVQAAGWTRTHREPRTYADIRRDYQEILRQGAQAPRAYRPPAAVPRSQAELSRLVRVAVLDLQTTVWRWSEDQLDTHLLPHPLMGLLSVREMLLFTLYHNHHHMIGVQRLRT